jgi:hypothetical protein
MSSFSCNAKFVSRRMLIWTFYVVVVHGIHAQNLSTSFSYALYVRSLEISVDVVTWYGLDNKRVGVQFVARVREFFLTCNLQTSSEACIVSYSKGNRSSFP